MNRVNTKGVFSNSEMFDPYEWPRWTWSIYIYMGQRSWGMCLDKYKWNHKFETVWVLLASVSTRRQTFGGFFKMFMLYCIYWLNTQNGCSANSAMSWLVESTWLKTMGYPKNRYYNGEKEQHLTKISNHPSIQDDVGTKSLGSHTLGNVRSNTPLAAWKHSKRPGDIGRIDFSNSLKCL